MSTLSDKEKIELFIFDRASLSGFTTQGILPQNKI